MLVYYKLLTEIFFYEFGNFTYANFLQYGRLSVVQDIISAWPQWLIVICIVTLHTLVTFFLNVPGCGAGYLGAGGLDDHGTHENCTGGAAGYIDRSIFGPHVYRHATCKDVYETSVNYDPEGSFDLLTKKRTFIYFYLQVFWEL